MKTETIRSWPDEELETQLAQAKRELFNLKVQQATRQIDQALRLRGARREVARILTLRHERRRAAAAKTETKI